MDTEILLNKFDDFNNEENIIEPFTDNYYKLKKWLTTIGGQLEPPVSQENGGQWQTCPKCNGQGCVSRPPWIPGDIVEWAGTTATYPCNVCNGKMIIKY